MNFSISISSCQLLNFCFQLFQFSALPSSREPLIWWIASSHQAICHRDYSSICHTAAKQKGNRGSWAPAVALWHKCCRSCKRSLKSEIWCRVLLQDWWSATGSRWILALAWVIARNLRSRRRSHELPAKRVRWTHRHLQRHGHPNSQKIPLSKCLPFQL